MSKGSQNQSHPYTAFQQRVTSQHRLVVPCPRQLQVQGGRSQSKRNPNGACSVDTGSSNLQSCYINLPLYRSTVCNDNIHHSRFSKPDDPEQGSADLCSTRHLLACVDALLSQSQLLCQRKPICTWADWHLVLGGSSLSFSKWNDCS